MNDMDVGEETPKPDLPRDRGRCRTIVLKVRQMRLTHYEDGLLCGDRFCINLIRHCGDTFPDLGEGKG